MLTAYFEGQTIPQNRPLIHISLWWGLWSGELSKAKCHEFRSLQNPKSLKMFCPISQPNVGRLKVMRSYFKGIDELFQTSHCDHESMHVWQQGGLRNVGCMVREIALLFCYCQRQRPFIYGQKVKCAKQFFQDISTKSLWIQDCYTPF